MVVFRQIVSLLLLLATIGCGSNSNSTTLSANMNSAIKTGRATVTSSTSTSDVVSAGIADQDLVSINLIGNLSKVFNVSMPIYGVATTPHYVIVSGHFTSTSVVDPNTGDNLNCYLYAISKTASGAPSDLICLSSVQVGDYNPTSAATDNRYPHLGFATRGTTVYFTDYLGGILYSWKEGDAAPTKLFSVMIRSGCPGFGDVFVDANSNHLCVLQTASTGCPSGYLYCGREGAFSTTIAGSAGLPILAETRHLGNLVVSTTQKVDLTTLSVSNRISNGINGGLPAGAQNVATDFLNGQVYIGAAGSLAYMTSVGATCVLASASAGTNSGCTISLVQQTAVYFQSLFGLGSYAWTYGTSDAKNRASGTQLRRIDLTNNTLSPTNYMSAAGMVSIHAMGLTPSGLIQVTGLNYSGMVVRAYIDAGGSISTSGAAGVSLYELIEL